MTTVVPCFQKSAAATMTIPAEKTSVNGAAVFACAWLILLARFPQAIFRARFYAEDGLFFYAPAYNRGWWHLFALYQGYMHLAPRMAAAMARLVPFAFAPLMMSLVALCIEALPAALILSPISERLGSLRFRAVLAALYLVVPNCREILLCVTESQWILALVALLILLGIPPANRRALACLYAVTMLTGPFCIFLLPFAVWIYSRERTGWKRLLLAFTASGAIIQATAIFTAREHPWLGASFINFIRIVVAQVYIGTLLGSNLFGDSFSVPLLCVALCGTAFFVWTFVKSNAYLRAIMIFGVVVLFASLLRPAVLPPPGKSAWELLTTSGQSRYWFFPCLTFAWSIAAGCFSRVQSLRLCSYVLVIPLLFGVGRDFYQINDWRIDPQFPIHARQFEQARRGEQVTIPVCPRGWKMVLLKH